MGNSNSKVFAWAIIAIIALTGLNGYQWFVNNQLRSDKVRYVKEMVELEKIQAELDQDYNSALESLEEMRSDNKELNNLIESQKKELKSQKNKINNLIWVKRELGKAKEEIENLNNQVSIYVAEAERLKEKISKLTADNSELKQENQVLTDKYQSEKAAKEEVSRQKVVLAQEKEQLAKVNEELDVKVDMANAVKINYMKVQGYKVTKSGKRKKRSRAKNIDLIEVCFTTETNMVTPSGKKYFQVRLISPQGVTVSREDSGGGVLTEKLSNTQVRYTAEGAIDYQNKDTDGCISWTLSEKLPKGKYEIEIYNNGFLVGKGTYVMKGSIF